MNLQIREGRAGDVQQVMRLLADGAAAPDARPPKTDAAAAIWDAMERAGTTRLYVAERDGRLVACYQLTILNGLSLGAPCRALIEGVQVADSHRGQGLGGLLMADAESRARSAGAAAVQLASDLSRTRAHRFYARLGYARSHAGFRKRLDS